MMTDEHLEALAKAIHQDYAQRQGEQSDPATDPSLLPWESLPESLQKSNRDQAAFIGEKLDAVACKVVALSTPGNLISDFDDNEIELLAQMEHARWVKERERNGWTAGSDRDVGGKRTPYLVPWDQLPEKARDLDRETVRAIPKFMADAGFGIARRS